MSCFCLGVRRVKEKDIEEVKEIMKQIVQEYKKSVKGVEKVVGFDDIPVYEEFNNVARFIGRTIRIYYIE